jgi:hypothetical protein
MLTGHIKAFVGATLILTVWGITGAALYIASDLNHPVLTFIVAMNLVSPLVLGVITYNLHRGAYDCSKERTSEVMCRWGGEGFNPQPGGSD